jgi:6-phosphogluconate dehydrogenase
MQLGMIGLGRMGANMTTRLQRGGHEVVVYDPNADAMKRAQGDGATPSDSLKDLVSKLAAPRAVWIMVPSGKITEDTISGLLEALAPGDVIIDGGNSNFHDTKRHYATCKEKQISFVDAGTSGGVWGLENGYCLMVGGDDDAVKRCEPVFLTLAPKDGYAHVGPAGAGHYSKMVHNGIEYGMLAAYGEGFEILETSEYKYDLHQLAELRSRSARIPASRRSAATSTIPAKAVGRCKPRSIRACPHPSSRCRCSRASSRARTSRSARRSSRRCATNSAATP